MKKGVWFVVLLSVVLVSSGFVHAAPGEAGRGRAKATVLFKMKAGADDAALARLDGVLAQYGLELNRYSWNLGHFRMKSQRAGLPDEETIAAEIEATGAVAFASPDYVCAPVFTPNDPYLGSQWFHTKINSRGAWDGSTGADVVVAVCDTGVDPNHADLQANLLGSLGYNTYNQNTDWTDVQGHGTWVSGCIAALGNNGVGVAGVAYDAKLIPIRVCIDSSGNAYYSDMAEGIRHGVDNGAKVINLSYSGWSGAPIRDAALYAWQHGATLCVAAGNDGADQSGYAESNYMLLVGATDSNDAKASFSNYGIPVDFFAPGVSIYTTSRGGGYGSVSGTSFSSPITAGLAALVYSVNPAFTPAEVEDIIMSTCVDLGAAGEDNVLGTGRIDAAAAVALAEQLSTGAPPVAVATATPTQAAIGQAITFDGSASSDPDGQVVAFAWTFGDGASADVDVTTHAYAAAGTYSATLTVTDNEGKTDSQTLTVTITDPSVVAAPTGLTATGGKGYATLRWTDNAANETNYYVERGTYDKRSRTYAWSRVAVLGANVTTYTQNGLSKGTWYFRVQAYNASTGAVSGYSNTASVNVR